MTEQGWRPKSLSHCMQWMLRVTGSNRPQGGPSPEAGCIPGSWSPGRGKLCRLTSSQPGLEARWGASAAFPTALLCFPSLQGLLPTRPLVGRDSKSCEDVGSRLAAHNYRDWLTGPGRSAPPSEAPKGPQWTICRLAFLRGCFSRWPRQVVNRDLLAKDWGLFRKVTSRGRRARLKRSRGRDPSL